MQKNILKGGKNASNSYKEKWNNDNLPINDNIVFLLLKGNDLILNNIFDTNF